MRSHAISWPQSESVASCLGGSVARSRGRFSGLLPEGFSHRRTKRKISAGKHCRPCRRFSNIHVAHPAFSMCLDRTRYTATMPKPSGWEKYVLLVVSVLLGVAFLGAGGSKLAGVQMHVGKFRSLGLPAVVSICDGFGGSDRGTADRFPRDPFLWSGSVGLYHAGGSCHPPHGRGRFYVGCPSDLVGLVGCGGLDPPALPSHGLSILDFDGPPFTSPRATQATFGLTPIYPPVSLPISPLGSAPWKLDPANRPVRRSSVGGNSDR